MLTMLFLLGCLGVLFFVWTLCCVADQADDEAARMHRDLLKEEER